MIRYFIYFGFYFISWWNFNMPMKWNWWKLIHFAYILFNFDIETYLHFVHCDTVTRYISNGPSFHCCVVFCWNEKQMFWLKLYMGNKTGICQPMYGFAPIQLKYSSQTNRSALNIQSKWFKVLRKRQIEDYLKNIVRTFRFYLWRKKKRCKASRSAKFISILHMPF